MHAIKIWITVDTTGFSPDHTEPMFRIAYREPRCRDCGAPNGRPVCACGYMRPLSDAFFVVPRGASLKWSRGVPNPRIPLSAFDLYRVRESLLAPPPPPPRHGGDGRGDGDGYGDGEGGGWGDGRGGGYGIFVYDSAADVAGADAATTADDADCAGADAGADAAGAEASADAAGPDDLVDFVIHELRRRR